MPFPASDVFNGENEIVTLKDFRYLVNDISRPYLFELQMPMIDTDSIKMSAYARSTTLPGYELNVVDIKFQTQTLKVAGGSSGSQSWTVEFLCDPVFSLRSKFIAWMSLAYEPSRLLTGSPQSYKNDATRITQLSRKGDPVQGYNFIGIFPSKVSDMTVSHESTDYHKFSVDFAFDFFTVESLGINSINTNVNLGVTGLNQRTTNSGDINTRIGNFSESTPAGITNFI